jgi:phosphoglycolate phosphatase-like HAD superfamily hydrolase
LLFQAAREHELNLAASWFIGDILNDVEAGRRADCRTILIDNGNETEWRLSPLRRPHYIVKNFIEATKAILDEDGTGVYSLGHKVPASVSSTSVINI